MLKSSPVRRYRRAAGALTLLPLVAALATMPAPAGADAAFRMGVPITVDPVRGVGEPIIKSDNAGGPWISGPGGSGTQTSFFWHSLDGGLTYSQLGPATGHWVCNSTGGGDSWLEYDKVNGDMYVTDQQSLADLALGKVEPDGHSLTAACFANPALTADRSFQAIIHPTGAVQAPQYAANGNKQLIYMSWQCNACGLPTGGGLAYAWSEDGVAWHVAEPQCIVDNAVGAQTCLGQQIPNYQWHGNMVADQETGYVYTALSCAGNDCPGSTNQNQFGIAVATPGTDAGNPGKFASITYQPASFDYQGTPWPEAGSLFPALAMDSAGTLYEMWSTVGTATSGTMPEQSGHVYYTYSKDKPNHQVWSPAIRVDSGPETATSTFPWIVAGDPGKVGFAWLGTNLREYPGQHTAEKQWWPFLALTTNGDTDAPTFQQDRVGIGASHTGDICLQGTTCGATFPPGNRNMADFISLDITPDGALQVVYADDANRFSTFPTTLVQGVPVTTTARQASGPRLIGAGDVSNPEFATTPRPAVGDRQGDGRYPTVTGDSFPQLDLTGSSIELSGDDIRVHMPVASLTDMTSPNSGQPNVWWLTTWQYQDKIYFARAESDGGGAPTFAAGLPATYDRPGLSYYSVPTLVDYQGGSPVTGEKVGNEFVLTVPKSLVGNPSLGDILEGVTSYTALDNGQQLIITTQVGNAPTITDATQAYDHQLGGRAADVVPEGPTNLPNTATPLPVVLVLLALLPALLVGGDQLWRRRSRGVRPAR
ncbi:MAG: hypothetical protein QOE92_2284 [Chloroflexota bacterium]|nr:hypothetical protein [Chloroflexota bacterium]